MISLFDSKSFARNGGLQRLPFSLVIDRPGVAGAVLQTPLSLIH